MPQLHQSVIVGGVVAEAGGGVEVDPLDLGQGIDVALGPPEVGFHLVPDVGLAEAVQDQGEAIVGELDGPDGLADEGLEGVMQAVGPPLDVGLAVIRLGEDVGDPGGDEPAVGEALVERMRGEMAVEELGEPESDQEAQQQGDVIDAFVSQFQGGGHGGTPARAVGKAPLYRRSRPDRKIQVKEREHGNAAQDGPIYNCRLSERLIRES